MVLPQDAAQASQASNIIVEREYRAEVAQYNAEQKKYEEELKNYNENLAKEKAAAEKAAAEKAKALEASKNYYTTTQAPERWIVQKGGSRTENPAYTAYEKNRPEVLAARAAQSPEANAKQDFLDNYVKQNPYAKGTEINRAVHKFESTQLKGMSEGDWNAYVKWEDANRAVALQQSASLRAGGNAQIKTSQEAELKRLGGSGSTAATNQGPTLDTFPGGRAPDAPGVAAVAQPWEKQFQRPVPVAPSTPESRWAEIATPGVGMFSGIESKPTYARPTAKGEVTRNRISPYLIPVGQRSLINQYSPEGKPVQGPARVEQRYSVTDSKGKVRTFKDLETAKAYNARTAQTVITPIGLTDFTNSKTRYSVGEKMFATEAEAQQYIDNPPVNLKGEAKLRYDISQMLDKASQYKSGNPTIDTAYSVIVGHPLGTVRSIVEGVNVLDNLGKYTIPGLIGTKPFAGTPIPVQRTGDEVLLPIEISETGIRQKSFGEIKSDSIEYARKYSVGDLMGGAISTYVPIGMGVKAGITTVGKFAAKRVAPKLISIATSERNLIGSTSTVRKVPATINPRKPTINKETLYTNIQSRQQGISGNPKLLAPYSQPKNPSLGTGVIPKESIKGSIKFSPDFIPNKPERPFVPLDTKRPVGIDPTYTPARRANEIDYTDSVIYGFRSRKLNLGQGVTKDRIGVMKTEAPFKPEPVKGDPMYRPSRRTNEIKMDDGYQIGFTESKVRLGVSQVKTPKPKGVTDFADSQFRGFQKSATVIGKIKLSKDFIPSKIRPAETKKLDFANPWRIKPRKFDEPKTGKGDRLTGKDGSIQIVKSKSEVVKLKKPQPTPVKILARQESATEGVQKAGSARPIVVLVKPAGRLATKKRKPVEARTMQSDYSEVTYQRTSAPQRISNIVSARSMTSARLSTSISAKLAVKTSPRLATRITPIIAQKQPQALKQSEAQKFRTPTPDPVRPKLRAAPKFRFKQPTRTVLREVPREPPRTKVVPIILPPIDDKKGKRKTKKNKEFGFLGNSKLDSLEGLFRRSDIIHGDKKIEKQIRKDKKSKFKERGVSFFSRR